MKVIIDFNILVNSLHSPYDLVQYLIFYLRNRSPTKILSNKTPYEVWSGVIPAVSHLRIFGCKGFMLDKRPGKSKFKPKGIECVMVGYSEESKAYRVYVPQPRKIFKSRDVKFLEDTGKAVVKDSCNDYIILASEVNEGVNNGLQPILNEENSDSENMENNDEDKNSTAGSKDDDVFADAVASEYNQSSSSVSDMGVDAEVGHAGNNKTDLEPIRITRSTAKLLNEKGKFNSLHFLNPENENFDANPRTLNDALACSDTDKWIEAMRREYNTLLSNKIWDLVDLPRNRQAIKCKWVFNIKRYKNGEIKQHKARLVAKGCCQKFGIDYKETFSPVTRYSTIRLILALAAEYNLFVHQMDVTAAYLNGELQEDIFMVQPECFVNPDQPNKVCKLKKTLYGLKQSGREWNGKLDKVLKNIGFVQCSADTCAYTMNKDREINIIAVYVDDIILASSNEEVLNRIKFKISLEFDVTDKGLADYFLRIEERKRCN